ncbi:hypothetical protein GCM10011316_20540 [Roseibium aquae]|uniref:Uncharacterized protein n=1 Tax=Roseibium aquae TaxID=1323746 RepID=A0A916TK02_9HYPH|nr:DUF6732 family protein [Roseibium aquae]GGB48274.1 hypothetical protein GCM10011316_20540 [Roseibium aquae]
MKYPIQIAAIGTGFLPGAALAHPGHLGELAGHSHWLGAAALFGAAAVAGVLAMKRRKKTRNPSSPEEQPETRVEDQKTGAAI